MSLIIIVTRFYIAVPFGGSVYKTILPAGTSLRCTLDEPNFSSNTAEVADPVLCPREGVRLFNRTAPPGGAYLGVHLVAVRIPRGHFVGVFAAHYRSGSK
jgi:hypothetical protein